MRRAIIFVLISFCSLLAVITPTLYGFQELWQFGASDPNKDGLSFSWDKLIAQESLIWKKCFPRGFECSKLIVPLDYKNLDGREASIALIRKPATVSRDSDKYKGPVLFNPGGPGGSGVEFIATRAGPLSSILGPQFDIVGFDPRGVGRSTPRVKFFSSDAERALFQETIGERRGLAVVNNSDNGIGRTWAQKAVQGRLAAQYDDGYLKFINTESTARDMLKIVEAHGREKLQYWGFSYGTVLGATFASIFPNKVERIVIDGVVDSEDYYATKWSHNLFDTDKTLSWFFKGCVEAGPFGCPFYAPSEDAIRRNLTAIYETVRKTPVPVHSYNSYGILDYSTLRSTIFSALYSPYLTFPLLGVALANLAAGDGNALFQLGSIPPFQCECGQDSAPHAVRDALTAILCNDGDDVPGDLENAQRTFEERMKSSSWNELWASIEMGCGAWPRFPKDHFQGPFEANTSHPILVIGNTADPVTPLWAAKKMSRGFKGSVVLTQDSPGHCTLAAPSVCSQKYIREYFINGSLPNPETVCAVDEQPFPTSLRTGKGFDVNSFQTTLSSANRAEKMTREELQILEAIRELSRMPGMFPLGI